jgi:LSD1 subclass zinc finger protein
MPLQVICPGCKKPLQLPDGSQGKPARCPMCQAVFAVGPVRPAAPAPSAPPPVRQPAPAPTATSPRPAPPSPPKPKPADGDTPAPRPRRKPDTDEEDEDEPAPRRRPKRDADEYEDERPARGTPKREKDDRSREDEAPALHLVLGVAHDPDRELRGDYVGELTDSGLRLRQGDDRIRVKVGSPVKHVRRNQIEIEVDERPVQFLVKGFAQGDGPPPPAQMLGLRVNRYRLASDLAAFLRGDRDKPLRVADYMLPWYLFAVAALPLGLPIVTCGGLIPIVGAILLCAATFAVVQRDRWPVFLRAAAAFGVSVVGYGLVIGIFALVSYAMGPTMGGTKYPTLPEKDWQVYKSPDGDYEVLLPGKPEALPELAHGVQVKIDRPETVFRLHYFSVDAMRRPDLTDGAVRREISTIWPEILVPIRHDYPDSKFWEGSFGNKGQDLIYEFRVADSNPKRKHMMVTEIEYNRFGDRVYVASVSTTGEMEYDLIKFFNSVHITYQPK